MAQKAPRTKAHAVKFTDADWTYVIEAAAALGVTPSAYVNAIVGYHVQYKELGKWQGLKKQGWPKGKKRKLTPTS